MKMIIALVVVILLLIIISKSTPDTLLHVDKNLTISWFCIPLFCSSCDPAASLVSGREVKRHDVLFLLPFPHLSAVIPPYQRGRCTGLGCPLYLPILTGSGNITNRGRVKFVRVGQHNISSSQNKGTTLVQTNLLYAHRHNGYFVVYAFSKSRFIIRNETWIQILALRSGGISMSSL